MNDHQEARDARKTIHTDTTGEPMTANETTKPLLLLDIDGVLNAFPDRAGQEYTRHTIDGSPIHLHVEVRNMVSALEEAFEIVWFTLWNHRATPGLGPHVGLADADHLTTSWERGWEAAAVAGYNDSAIRRLMYAKTPLLPGLIDPQRPWVWIDDAHTQFDQEYLVAAGLDPRTFRLVATDPQVGLMWADVERAISFARAIADGREVESDAFAGTTPATPRFPGSVVGRVEVVRDDETVPEVDQLDAELQELLAELESDGSGVCPRCGGVTRPVVYGFPSPELFDRADRGEVILGGCCLPVEPARSQCPNCD